MTGADPNFFILLLLGGAVLYGLWPLGGTFALVLAMLWVLGKAPLLFLALACLWLRWRPLRWALDFFIGGYAAGLGFGAAFGRRRARFPRRRAWSEAELRRAELEDRRGPPRTRGRRPADYQPFNDPLDMG